MASRKSMSPKAKSVMNAKRPKPPPIKGKKSAPKPPPLKSSPSKRAKGLPAQGVSLPAGKVTY